jgi:hypothetical protein
MIGRCGGVDVEEVVCIKHGLVNSFMNNFHSSIRVTKKNQIN